MALDTAVRNKWLSRAGYTALAFVSFVYFLYLGFPFDRVLPRVLADLEKEADLRIETGSIRSGWLFSLVATDVKLYSTGGRGPAAEDPDPTLRIDKVSVSPKPFALLTGKLGVKLDALLYGGRVRGTIVTSKSASSVDLAIEGIEIAKYPKLAAFNVAASGQIGGTVKLEMDPQDGTKTTGKIDLQVANPRVEESNLILVKIPTTVFERGGAAIIDFKDGKAEIVDVGLHGEDLDMSVEGEILLRKRLASSQWSAKSIIKASEKWKSAVPGIEAIIGPGKCGNGNYQYRIAGVLGGLPRTVPDRSCR